MSDQTVETRDGGYLARLRQIGAEQILLPIGIGNGNENGNGNGRSVSWLTLQAVLFFIGCVICSCCSITSFMWGNESLQITLPAPTRAATISPSPSEMGTPAQGSSTSEPLAIKPSKPTTPPGAVETEPPPSDGTPPPPTESPVPDATPAPKPTPTSAQSPLSTPTARSQRDPTPTPTHTPNELTQSPLPPPPTNPPDSLSNLHIVHVEHSRPGRDWTEEHVLIENQGAIDLNLTGWRLGSDESDAYEFPTGFVLNSNMSVRVWSTDGADTEAELYWGREESAWPPADGLVYLWDDSGAVVDRQKW